MNQRPQWKSLGMNEWATKNVTDIQRRFYWTRTSEMFINTCVSMYYYYFIGFYSYFLSVQMLSQHQIMGPLGDSSKKRQREKDTNIYWYVCLPVTGHMRTVDIYKHSSYVSLVIVIVVSRGDAFHVL